MTGLDFSSTYWDVAGVIQFSIEPVSITRSRPTENSTAHEQMQLRTLTPKRPSSFFLLFVLYAGNQVGGTESPCEHEPMSGSFQLSSSDRWPCFKSPPPHVNDKTDGGHRPACRRSTKGSRWLGKRRRRRRRVFRPSSWCCAPAGSSVPRSDPRGRTTVRIL